MKGERDMGILDIIMLTKKYYRKLTDNRFTLFLGVIFVGITDVFIPYLLDNLKVLFIDKTQAIVYQNLLTTVVLIFLLGTVDVFFFAIPLFDLFKVFKKENEGGPNSIIRLMKVYISAHFLIVPVNLLLYFFTPAADSAASSGTLGYLTALLALVVIIWFSAIITRGINSIYSFEPIYRKLIFIIVFIWNFLLGIGLEYILNNWLWKLFR